MLVGLRPGFVEVHEITGIRKKFYYLIIVCRECGGLCCCNSRTFSGEKGEKELQYGEIAEIKCCRCSSGGLRCFYCKKR